MNQTTINTTSVIQLHNFIDQFRSHFDTMPDYFAMNLKTWARLFPYDYFLGFKPEIGNIPILFDEDIEDFIIHLCEY